MTALSLDGRPTVAEPGETVAVALARAGRDAFATSISGEPRGPLCGMGICHECRVTIDGERHRLACLTPCAEGMRIGDTLPPMAPRARLVESCEVLVIGGGPAGLAAASAAHQAGADVLLLDEQPALGGAIGKRPDPASIGFRVRSATRVVAALPGALLAEDERSALQVRYRRLILATGARELFLPIPGWTLPGAMGAGALQLLAKGGWPVAGKRVLLGGTGPLLLAAAAGLKQRGARVIGVAELAPRARINRFALGLWRQPGKLAQAARLSFALAGVPLWTGSFVRRIDGEGKVASATVSVRGKERTLACDLVGTGFGLVPNLELPALLGCATDEGRVRVDELCRTSVNEVFCAGEGTQIGGADKSIIEGRIAGLCAAGREGDARRLLPRRRRALDFAHELERCYPAPARWDHLQDDTIVCRCEDVRWGALRDAADFRSARLHTRVGMGACQGRVCGAALAILKGFSRTEARPPASPARLETLAFDEVTP